MKFKLQPAFTAKDLERETKKILAANYWVTLNELAYIGLQFVQEARSKAPTEGSFNDDTGNLRASLGYIIMYNGKRVQQDFSHGSAQEGKSKGLEFANKVGTEYPKGWALILVAGMFYASYVEGYGYDVLTGSTLNAQSKMSGVWERVSRAFEAATSK